MALSDDLTKLATRAKQAEIRTAAARDAARADLEREVSAARASTQATSEKLRETAEQGEAKAQGWWTDVQRSWNEQVARIRADVESEKTQHDVHQAERTAENAEDYANFAVDLAYTAVVEAEYAALDAVLARKDADQLAQQAGATA